MFENRVGDNRFHGTRREGDGMVCGLKQSLIYSANLCQLQCLGVIIHPIVYLLKKRSCIRTVSATEVQNRPFYKLLMHLKERKFLRPPEGVGKVVIINKENFLILPENISLRLFSSHKPGLVKTLP